ncbi:MAG: hypothetical protein MUC48_25870 [Leptolyngbya sp. Prado105]|jgi:hypothetical protein|nr:hypothetical protein [Leptolyngbya sp. Prado105]
MTAKQRLIQGIEQAPDPLIEKVLDSLLKAKSARNRPSSIHPLAQFAGILSDDEAQELQVTIANEWKLVTDDSDFQYVDLPSIEKW